MYFYSSRKIEKRWLGIVVSSCMDEVIMKLVLTDTNTEIPTAKFIILKNEISRLCKTVTFISWLETKVCMQ
jgi:hypothetical protein